MTIDIVSDVKMYEKGGFPFFNVTQVHVKYNIGGLKLHMGNLFDGISSLGEFHNSVIYCILLHVSRQISFTTQ